MPQIIFILLLLSAKIFAQEIILKGYIVDEGKNPVKNAIVELIQGDLKNSKISDSLGFFNFKIKSGKVKISVKHLSFKQFDKELNVHSDTLIFIQLSTWFIKFNEITVTATRYQANTAEISNFIEVINSKTIEKTSPISFSDVLKNATSIYIRDYGGTPAVLKTISLRGTGSEHTVFLLNGMRFSSYQNGVLDLSLIPVDIIERVEIIHSNLSSLYGADAIGGVVNVITKKEEETVKVNLGFGSFGLRKFNAGISSSFKNLSYLSSFSKIYGSGDFNYKYKLADKYITLKRRNAYFNISNMYLNISYQNFSISTFYTRSNRGIPAQVTKFDPISTAWQFDEDFNFSISTLKTFPTFVLKASAMFRNSYLRYVNNDVLISGSGIDSYSHNIFYTGVLNSIFKLGSDFILSFGLESSFGVARGNSFENAKRFNIALFLSGEKKIDIGSLPSLKIYPMLRNDYFSDFGNKFVYKLGVNSQILNVPSLNIKFSYGTGFRAPTFNDLYWHGSGNRDLKPEKSKSYDFGFVVIAGSNVKVLSELKFELSFFNIDIEDRIIWLPSQENQSVWRPINIDHVNSRGSGFSGELVLFNKLFISGNFSIVKSIRTNKRAQDDATQNKYLIYIPRSNGYIKAELNFDKFFFVAQANYVGLRYTTEVNDRWLQPYLVVDFTGGLSVKNQFFNGQVKFTVKNIFNENYESMVGYPMPLRSFMVEFSTGLNYKQKQKGEIRNEAN
ncbi:TonB-dependent receptor plug domain-containing protein [Candidatus Kryptobacter tengchongensis]|uniref:Outer membrane receptor for ferrienterochelin and colicins n=1 Tax=Kryptobacter tengchongensis TaxID=1643429 RepID=A0A656DCL7_KRYT1|nr:TonB-dependent receptor [Candidatus Kryptobacter tengchongensis]CUT04948.1 Outer membrane receptor for ferrienterochelin and colicins [Candidatus Kryptobacter tengchongensis]